MNLLTRRPHCPGPRCWVSVLIGTLVLLLVAPPLLVTSVGELTRPRRFEDVGLVPTQRVAVVFGAGLRSDGQPTPILADRVRAAVELYRSGRVHKLLMSGDNSSVNYNEVAAMRRLAIEQGVPAADITLDYAGFSTYESCYRAREIFGVTQAVLVTQRYHLPRAVYTCTQLGINAVGLGTPDWGVYSPDAMRLYTAREVLATLNALWQLHITHPQPTFLGPYVGIA